MWERERGVEKGEKVWKRGRRCGKWREGVRERKGKTMKDKGRKF